MPAPCGCEGAGLWRTVRQDVDRYVFEVERDGRHGLLALVRALVLSPGLWAVLGYRFAHHAYTRLRPRALGTAIGLLHQLGQRMVLTRTGIEIDPHAHIGPGLLIPHSGYIVIGPVRIGRHCCVSQGVTLGHSTTEEDPSRWATPVLEDRVWIGPGAVVAGGLTVGADAAVGANSVVVRDVPPRGVVLGIPARLVSRAGSFAQVRYRGMDGDAERAAARKTTDGAAGAATGVARPGTGADTEPRTVLPTVLPTGSDAVRSA